MSVFQDIIFLEKHSLIFQNFKKKSDLLYNCRCPLCGDSKKKKFKNRGYFLRGTDSLIYKCHNCGICVPYGKLLQQLDADIYKEYVVESFLGKEKELSSEEQQQKKIKFKQKKDYKPAKPLALIGCPSISALGPDHPARIYIEQRQIPKEFHKDLFWTDDFPSVVNNVCPNNTFTLVKEGRLIIPFWDKKHQLIAIQGRSLDDNGIRYITVKSDENSPKIFGMHRLDPKKVFSRVYIVEGPLDSVFLDSCLALAGSDIPKDLPKNRCVIVYDNEPRKPETIEKIRKAIDDNWTVCIWPNNIVEKDINEMILAGYKAEKIREIIDLHLFKGLQAKLKLQHWSNPKGFIKVKQQYGTTTTNNSKST